MTAIASVYSPEGFVIGADGRQINPEGRIESETVPKIAPNSAVNVIAMSAWTGSLKFGGTHSSFEVKNQAIEVAESFRFQEFATLAEYAGLIGLQVFTRLREWLRCSGGIINRRLADVAQMRLLGYVNDSPQAASIILRSWRGALIEPGIGEPEHPLSPEVNVFSGNKSVWDSMSESVAIHECSSLEDGQEMIRLYIDNCAKTSVPGVNSIGGHIHIAATTQNGFYWLIPPK